MTWEEAKAQDQMPGRSAWNTTASCMVVEINENDHLLVHMHHATRGLNADQVDQRLTEVGINDSNWR